MKKHTKLAFLIPSVALAVGILVSNSTLTVESQGQVTVPFSDSTNVQPQGQVNVPF